MQTELRHTVFFQRAIDDVFDFVTTLEHWPRWYPATLRVECDHGPLRAGARAVEHVRKLGLPGVLHWVVTECERPRRFAMETTAIHMLLFGRAKLRIEYELHAESGGTRLTRVWRYELPPPILPVLDRLYLRRNLIAE